MNVPSSSGSGSGGGPPSAVKRPLKEEDADPAADTKRARTSAAHGRDPTTVLAMEDAAIDLLPRIDAVQSLVNLKHAYTQLNDRYDQLQQEHAAASAKWAKDYAQVQQELITATARAAALRAPLAGASTSASASSSAGPAWTPTKIADTAARIRDNTSAAIEKQMKWQPTCREGRTKWKISVLVPMPQVFKAIFNFPDTQKEFKQKKLTKQEFEAIFGSLQSKMRYGMLYLSGPTVTLKWDAEEHEFTLSGTYGLQESMWPANRGR
ncbi:unnamed protein product [Tilletia controversa]|uniref:Uncharacterized protein n=1 Tax=Tilletia controversa TaxID=13291 RepID=A0A8X7T0E2_9BASI|nr:hypothetical protein CF328_g1809 [Tilletia controversa]KAE8254832.1 hypothetical protein A4X06_0g719 [Tilletia controversa]CAD6918181.1 unnamed protein product [Tilletia controversa]CAD6954845.1 unnamed protein product [Tilletia controversa]CAD6955590.1 unnamed protein product [Tilletia controversa]